MRPLFAHCLWMLALTSCASLHYEAAHFSGWREYQTEHFVVQTALPEERAFGMVETLELYRQALTKSLGTDIRGRPPLRVVILSEVGELEKLGASRNVAGAFISDPIPTIVLPATSWRSAEPIPLVQVHELVHYFCSFIFPRGLPRWLGEGLADYLSTIALDRSQKAFIVGRPNPWRFVGPSDFVSLEDLWAWRPDAGPIDVGRRYAASWVWVHFLVNREPERFTQFLQALALAKGSPSRSAFESAFSGVDMGDLNLRASHYLLSQEKYAVTTFPLLGESPVISQRALGPEDALYTLHEISRSSAANKAMTEYATHNLSGTAEEAILTELSKPNRLADPQRRQELMKQFPSNARVTWALARYSEYFPQVERDVVTARALELSPHNAEVLIARVRSLTEQGRAAEALPLVDRILFELPFAEDAILASTEALVSAGACEQARELVDRLPYHGRGQGDGQTERIGKLLGKCAPP